MPSKPLLGISYYGSYHKDNIIRDLHEISALGFKVLVLAVSENDWNNFREVVKFTAAYAKSLGLEVIIDLWGFAGCFGGEAGSLFLTNYPEMRQTLNTGEKVPLACLNHLRLKEFLKTILLEMSTQLNPDGFFLDEPHFFYNPPQDKKACFCQTCLALAQKNKLDLSNEEDLAQHKNQSLISFCKELLEWIKTNSPQLKTIICIFPTQRDKAYQKKDLVLLSSLDVLATDPYWQVPCWKDLFEVKEDFVSNTTKELIQLTSAENKQSEVWIQAFAIRRGEEEKINKYFREVYSLKPDRIMFWTYRCGWGSIASSEDAEACWEMIKKEMKELAK